MAYDLRYGGMGSGELLPYTYINTLPLYAEFQMFLSYTTWSLINKIFM